MNAHELRAKVAAEIAAAPEGDQTSNHHGVDLGRCLLKLPARRKFSDTFDGDRIRELWLVLEEDPIGCAAYKIVYDEARDTFGLAVGDPRQAPPAFIGFYGSFLDTLAGM
jgi:hypothetical protein